MNRKIFWLGFATGIISTVIIGLFVVKSFIIQPDVSLSSLKLQDLSGKQVKTDELLGKPLVINYWATSCAPCRHEFPEFEKVKSRLGDKFNLVMISDEKTERIANFKKNNPYTFTYLVSGQELQINTRPVTSFYNSKGELISQKTGTIDEKELTEMVEKLCK